MRERVNVLGLDLENDFLSLRTNHWQVSVFDSFIEMLRILEIPSSEDEIRLASSNIEEKFAPVKGAVLGAAAGKKGGVDIALSAMNTRF